MGHVLFHEIPSTATRSKPVRPIILESREELRAVSCDRDRSLLHPNVRTIRSYRGPTIPLGHLARPWPRAQKWLNGQNHPWHQANRPAELQSRRLVQAPSHAMPDRSRCDPEAKFFPDPLEPRSRPLHARCEIDRDRPEEALRRMLSSNLPERVATANDPRRRRVGVPSVNANGKIDLDEVARFDPSPRRNRRGELFVHRHARRVRIRTTVSTKPLDRRISR